MMSSYWGRQMVCGLQLDFDSLQASSDRILWCACGHAWGGLIRASASRARRRAIESFGALAATLGAA
jgi:hypothetical protein